MSELRWHERGREGTWEGEGGHGREGGREREGMGGGAWEAGREGGRGGAGQLIFCCGGSRQAQEEPQMHRQAHAEKNSHAHKPTHGCVYV